MSMERFPVGQEMDVAYPDFAVSLTLLSATQLMFKIKDGPFARTETVDIEVVPIGNGIFAVSWQEKDGATVMNIQDHDRSLVHSFATLPGGQFIRMAGPMVVTRPGHRVSDHRPERNRRLVIDAMTSLFQRRDASAVERLYAHDYVQHNPSIPQGRDALQALVAGLPRGVYYEPGLTVAEGDFVAIHGRIRGWAETPQVVVEFFRIVDGKLAEHWNVLQNEVPAAAALGGISMFDPEEASRQARSATVSLVEWRRPEAREPTTGRDVRQARPLHEPGGTDTQPHPRTPSPNNDPGEMCYGNRYRQFRGDPPRSGDGQAPVSNRPHGRAP